MKSKASHGMFFRLRVLLALCASVLLSASAPYSTAQSTQDNRQLQPDSAHPTSQTSQRRIALVIGNGAYTNAPPLKNPPNDARDMAATLTVLGFEVIHGVNVNQRDMKRMIREFGRKLRDGGSGLFYFAGHGVQSKGKNYLIPIEADIQSEVEVEDAGVDVNLVLGYMDDAQNGLNVVILDACRNNPFARSFRSASNGLAQVDAPSGTLIAYATAPGRVAFDGTGQNGLYTSELLKELQVPGVSITDMFMRVRAEVMKRTSGKQIPWESSSLVGAFYFNRPTKPPNESTQSIEKNSGGTNAFELTFWDSIKNSIDAEDYRNYLERYPNGQFADLARRRIASTITTYANEKSNFRGKLRDDFLRFSFDYPSSWKKEIGTDDNGNFVKVEKLDVDGITVENFAVGNFYGSNMRQLVSQLSNEFSKTMPEFLKVSENEVQIGALHGYEFRYTGQSKPPKHAALLLWGRCLLLFDPSGSRGAVLVLIATSRSKSVQSISDIGRKGDLGFILNSFRFHD